MRHQATTARAGVTLAAVARRQMTRSIRPRRGQARRHEQQPRRHLQKAHQITSGRRVPCAQVVFRQQHRDTGGIRTGPPVIEPMARQMHHLDGRLAQSSEPVTQLLRVTRVIHHQIDAGLAHGVEDGRFLSLIVQFVLAPRGGSHERQAQPEITEPGRLLRRPKAAHHTETGECVLGQEPPTWGGQQFERCPQHRPRRIRR